MKKPHTSAWVPIYKVVGGQYIIEGKGRIIAPTGPSERPKVEVRRNSPRAFRIEVEEFVTSWGYTREEAIALWRKAALVQVKKLRKAADIIERGITRTPVSEQEYNDDLYTEYLKTKGCVGEA